MNSISQNSLGVVILRQQIRTANNGISDNRLIKLGKQEKIVACVNKALDDKFAIVSRQKNIQGAIPRETRGFSLSTFPESARKELIDDRVIQILGKVFREMTVRADLLGTFVERSLDIAKNMAFLSQSITPDEIRSLAFDITPGIFASEIKPEEEESKKPTPKP